ncbi:MAG: iron ABC transporter permease, partial [Planctomycetes bacterium]|nr:iron ABC transporter permease [Planctomycetota bacterium]
MRITRRDLLRAALVIAAWSVLLAAAAAARILIGEEYGWPAPEVLELRAQRLAIGSAVGAALAASGVMLQALLRNPLASPYVLGLSSGATLGVFARGLLPILGGASLIEFGADHTAAVIGAVAVMAVVYALGQKRGRIDPLGLLLVGVIINSINGAAIMFISYLAPHFQRGHMTLWLLGYFNENAAWTEIAVVASVTLAGVAAAAWLGPATDVATLSSVEAHGLGLRIHRLRIALFVLAGILTAGSVMLAGPIGFVGLVCPHLVRLSLGPRHRPLVIGSAL